MKKSRLFALLMVFVMLFTSCGQTDVPADDSQSSGSSGVLTVEKGSPNPNGNLDELYLLVGDANATSFTIDESLVSLPDKSSDCADTLKIYHINDMHSNIMTASGKGDTHNLAQMKKIIDDAKANGETVLFVTAGDDHIGSSNDELLGNNADAFEMSAPYTAYSAAGMDFAALGNHEFDKKTEILSRMINENATFSVIASNIYGSQYELGTSVAAIGVVDGIRVGVIGLTIPEETALQTSIDPNLNATNPLDAVNAVLPAIEPYCDALIILSHNGYEGSDRYTLASGEGAIAELASTLTEKPVVVIGGHTHEVLNENGLSEDCVYNGVPVLQAGQYGNYLGEVSFNISGDPAYTAKLNPIISGKANDTGAPVETEADYDVEFQTTVIDPMMQKLEERMAEVIATTGSDAAYGIEQTNINRYTAESAMANFMNDAIVARSADFSTGPVDFAVFNSSGIGGVPNDNTITYGDIYSILPYADTLYVVEVTGQDIKDILENNAPRIVNLEKFQGYGGELDPNSFVETGFSHFSSGIRYTIVLGDTPEENTIKDVTLNGEDIDTVLDKTYTICFSSYLAVGRGGWQGEVVGQGIGDNFVGYDLKTLCAEKGTDLGLIYRTEWIDFIKNEAGGIIDASTGAALDGRLVVEG